MKMTINIVANILKADADRYRKEYDKALTEKGRALESAKKNFIGDALKVENERIENEFNSKIVELRTECAKGIEDINSLREQEKVQVQGFDKNTVEKVMALHDIPMTEDEFIALMDDVRIASNYMAKKVLMTIAEKNGIDVTKIGIGADYSTKLDVLNQLEQQLTSIISNYPDGNFDHMEAIKCKHVYLSEDIVNRAIGIYGGKLDIKSDDEKADKAFLTIKSKHGDMERAFAISNALRNAKGEAVRNRLLYKLSSDSELSDISLQMSGAYNEINNFRQNSVKDYGKAIEAMDRVRKATAKDSVDLVLSENSENAFFNKMYDSEMKKNDYLRSFMNPEYTDTTNNSQIGE